MKQFENEDRLVYKQKALCQHSSSHQKKEAIFVCVEKTCIKQALCAICVNQEHQRHKVEMIDDIKQRAINYIEKQGKLQQNKEIILLEQVEQNINERFLSMQVALGRALKNFNEKIHLYKESIKREQLDILYQIEFACEGMKSGKNINSDLFNKNYNLLYTDQIQEDAGTSGGLLKTGVTSKTGEQVQTGDNPKSSDLLKAGENFLQIRRIDVIRADLQTMSEKLQKCQQNFSDTISKYTHQFNKIFADGVEDDEYADLKLKLYKNNHSARQSISIHGDPFSKSGNDSFDILDSLQFLVNEISDDFEDDASANRNGEGGQHSVAEASLSNDNSSSARPSIRRQNNRSSRPSIRKIINGSDQTNIVVQVDDDSFAQIEKHQENQESMNNNNCQANILNIKNE